MKHPIKLKHMKRRLYIAGSTLFFALFLGAVNAQAQRDSLKMKQEVEVTKAYQPTVNEAVKINDIPVIKSEQTEPPVFEYSIFSKPVFTSFDLTPIAAAKMVGDPRAEMNNGLLKLGFGNYLTPYGELFFNVQPDKKSNFGMHFSSLSSFGDLTLKNGDQVNGTQSDNSAEIFGKKFFRKSTLSGSLGFDRKSFRYYGYTGEMLTDDQKDQMIPFFEDKQHFTQGTAAVRLKSESLSGYDLNYDFGINYHYMASKTGQTESELNFSSDLMKKYDKFWGGLHIGFTRYSADSIFNRFSNTFSGKQQILIDGNPFVKWEAKTAYLQAGLNITAAFDDDTDAALMIWPKVKAEWSPVKEVLTLFAGVDGHLKHNTYSAIAAENPYVDPYHDIANSNYKYILSGGFKGKLTARTNYVAEVAYSKIADEHFYVVQSQNLYNPQATNRILNNTFGWVYDDINVTKLSGEVLHFVSDDFSVHFLGNYYSYKLNSEQQAWQMPDFDATLSGIFKPTEQLRLTVDLFAIGKRKAQIQDYELPLPTIQNPDPVTVSRSDHEVSLKPYFDVNFGADYRLAEKLSVFMKLNNLAFQKYEQWSGYTSKGFNWMAGLSYRF